MLFIHRSITPLQPGSCGTAPSQVLYNTCNHHCRNDLSGFALLFPELGALDVALLRADGGGKADQGHFGFVFIGNVHLRASFSFQVSSPFLHLGTHFFIRLCQPFVLMQTNWKLYMSLQIYHIY